LVGLLKVRFSQNEGTNYEEMKKLVQVGTIREYMRQFEIIKSRSQVEFYYLPESYYVMAFISGLRDDIKHLVLSQNYHSLLDAFQYAKHMEASLEFQFKRSRTMLRSHGMLPYTNFKQVNHKERQEEVKGNAEKENSRNTLVEHRRSLGLCFKCGEKYFLGH